MSPTEIPLASDNNSYKQPEFQMQTIITHIRNYFFNLPSPSRQLRHDTLYAKSNFIIAKQS
ncbi:hypothetical protein THS27_24670 [Thalassospira sp. MCCC 1A01428]|nr:hypothetical protein THS27_24670 [Thalassospira sp. MCCC 1A01428]